MSDPVVDPLLDRVPLLMNFDGAIVDSSPAAHPLTWTANASIDSARQRFGAGCLNISTQVGQVATSAAVDLAVGGSVPWTLELSVLFPGSVPWSSIFVLGNSSDSTFTSAGVFLGTVAGELRVNVHGAQSGPLTGAVVADRWHQAMVRSMPGSAGTWVRELWLDGALIWSYSSATPPSSMANTGSNWGRWYFGFAPNVLANAPGGPCLIDSVRLTNAYARAYTEQTSKFGVVAPTTYWPGAGQAWPGGAVAR